MTLAVRRLALVGALAACACVVSSPSVTAAGQAGDAATPVPENVRSSRLPDGTLVLTDPAGMTLYTFLKDTPEQSNCNDNCAVQWPPATAVGTPPGDAWKVIARRDGSTQWAYKGRPLYRWARDTNPGDISGDGVAAGAWKVAVVDRPADVFKVHLAHLTTSYRAAPKEQGLLPTALAEATIAAQHAALAVKSRNNIEALKLHAGHVIHALDPSIEPKGPGLGFGVKRATTGIAEHIQLAARVVGAPQAILDRGSRVIVSSNGAVKKATDAVAVAERIRAAAAVDQTDVDLLDALVRQLIAGVDVNNDGTIGWQTGESGLTQVGAELTAITNSLSR